MKEKRFVNRHGMFSVSEGKIVTKRKPNGDTVQVFRYGDGAFEVPVEWTKPLSDMTEREKEAIKKQREKLERAQEILNAIKDGEI